ncbi:MAG: FAD-dependent oxidoreductase [Spirochaetes bacterium]|uniref:FAD-dependent oxidoreductase n=1 Tax=Candidatus Ornithospirochaeta stercoripullorum TaxID=2840899 RepID=A0A9D9E4E9_9SPIO|nr:FAD-dependent oxidoreductase [Candidatus Ornithospirochaeta stercoripullorum]
MKVLVIGGVAAGTKVAAKLKREDRSAEVCIITKGKDISYAGCGLPYFISGVIENRSDLIVNTPEKFSALTGVSVITEAEATAVDFIQKSVTYIKDGKEENVCYDKLVIATGAESIVPPLPGTGLEGVFTLRTPDDAERIRAYGRGNNVKNAVVVGAGFIGLETAENLRKDGISVTVIDVAGNIMPNAFDDEMASWARKRMEEAGFHIMTNTHLEAIEGEEKASGVKTDKSTLNADLVVLALGVRPATAFLAGTALNMEKGAIVTAPDMSTNISDVYAAGDCALVINRITGKSMYSAMGSTANISGRVLAKNLVGKHAEYPGAIGTGVVKLFDNLNAARTGLTEESAKQNGYDVISVVAVADDKAHYYPDSSFFIMKMIAERKTHRILGFQVLGSGNVDKMNDIAVVAVSQGMRVEDFDTMDFSYAPPFSTAISPFVQVCNILENKISGEFVTMSPSEYAQTRARGYKVVDVMPEKTIPGAFWVNLGSVNGPVKGLDKDEKLLLVCARGKRGYFLQNRLKHYGYTNTKVLEGGITFNDVRVDFGSVIPPEEVKRVKGLGCLQDKRMPDHFNVRVITRNGKLTADEQIVVAEAAKRFGSGEVTMTTRLTLEIQDVLYDNIENLIVFLKEHGLETGGTGSKVRPVVSCKGTTCQYGLIDTFELSEKLHNIFYEGWHNVSLPHKFKIAVGGCPNNCVKPSLNDIGIIGQRLIDFDYGRCRGCKVCQVVNSCPIKTAQVADGKLVVKADECNHCGRCLDKCPFGVTAHYTTGYAIYVGGRWGKKIELGKRLSRVLTSEEEVIKTIENAILLFRDEGKSGERFADTVNRLGLEYVEEKLFSSSIDKEAILNKTVVGGATC